MQTYQGQCHCGAVTYECQFEPLEKVFTCDCSHCDIKGLRLTFLPGTQFTLLSGEEALTEYLFNKKHISHLFCKTCGVQCFARGNDPEGNETIAVNLRTLKDFDSESLPEQRFNGKDL